MAQPTDTAGTGSPENSVVAVVGSSYRDRSSGAFYMKTSGAGNTGWLAVLNTSYSPPAAITNFLSATKWGAD